LPRAPVRPRLRHAGRREVGRSAGARASPRAASRAVGRARSRRRRRPGRARDGSGACGRGRRAPSVRRTASPRLRGYAVLAALGLLLGIALGRPELVALGAPFALFLGVAVATSRPPALRVDLALGADAAVEGHDVEVELELASEDGVERIDMALTLPEGIVAEELPPPSALHLPDGEPRRFEFRLHGRRWGAYRGGEAVVRTHDRFGIFAYEARLDAAAPLRVYPRPEWVRDLVRALETQPFAGNEVARTKGEGIEFADIRPFVFGDRVRRINWRASAKRREVYVSESHPERNTDVVLFLDAFTDVGAEAGGTLEHTIRAAATLARAYLRRRDRVGLVSFSGIVHWLTPATGERQLYRIVETLLETSVVASYVWRGIDHVPVRTLPPKALVVALTPLLDERSVRALLDLRARGFDLVIVEVSPLPYIVPGGGAVEALAHRLWTLWRDALRFRYRRLGVPVVEWREGVPLAQAVEEVIAFRRSARLASVR